MAKVASVPRFRSTVFAVCRGMAQDLFGDYRPELHYMRGPGPKWREKHLDQAIEHVTVDYADVLTSQNMPFPAMR